MSEPIWVLDSGWHTGLIVPSKELSGWFHTRLQTAHARYLMFGWGNRKFYMTPKPTIGMDIAALFPSKSVVLIEGCKRTPRACYTDAVKLRKLRVSRDGLKRLDTYLSRSLATGAHQQPIPLGPGPDPGSEFYASGLTYDAFHTCNTWTAEALHAAGLPVAYHGVIFAGQLWRQINKTPAEINNVHGQYRRDRPVHASS